MVDKKVGLKGRRWMLAACISAGLLMATAPWVLRAQTSLDATAT